MGWFQCGLPYTKIREKKQNQVPSHEKETRMNHGFFMLTVSEIDFFPVGEISSFRFD